MSSKRTNLRRADVMERVSEKVKEHYRSRYVDALRQCGNELKIGSTTIRLAEQFGFCYGVQRAIDLAYASRDVFPTQNIYLIGEIIHNPEVNRQLKNMGIRHLPWQAMTEEYDGLTAEDVVIVPAFGAPTEFMNKLKALGVSIIDTTCGDVMKVWRRVGIYAKEGVSSIIHGKVSHEETRATASRALGDGTGKFLVILTMEECDYVCDYIRGKGNKELFLEKFRGAYSTGFDPEFDLKHVGIANQTTMLKGETEAIQAKLKEVIVARDGSDAGIAISGTICGATQDRQNSLFSLLAMPLDMLLVVGGYNSSNTTHLVEIAEKKLPTFFIGTEKCLVSMEEIIHFDLQQKKEITSSYGNILNSDKPLFIGITAGASCPSNLIEGALIRLCQLRGISREQLEGILGF